jgi:DNA repair protein RadC
MSVKKWNKDDRPRERLLTHGARFLSDSELVAIILGSGTQEHDVLELSRIILKSVNDDLNKLSRLSIDELMQTKGIGPAKAVHLSATFELGRRLQNVPKENQIKITSSEDAFRVLAPKMASVWQEEFWVVFLNRTNVVTEIEQLHIGTTTTTLIDIKSLMKKAVNKLAESIIVAHNHPSGNVQPSEQDKLITQKIKKAGELLDIQLLDHLIIAQDAYFSFLDEGLV